MSFFLGLKCLRCGAEHAEPRLWEGCPVCNETFPCNVTPYYDYRSLKEKISQEGLATSGPGIWKYDKILPVGPESRVSLKEGNTPLIRLERLGAKMGLENLVIKDESRNPTGSYKDRLCAVAISKAVELGYQTVVVSSTGNQGASTAAYAARAGLDSVVFTTVDVPQTMKTLMQSYGASVVATQTPAERWVIMERCVKELGWFPVGNYINPPVGSNPYGIEGYKTIAYEIVADLKQVPDFVVVPVAYGDGLYGIWKGFNELQELGLINKKPRMIAAEPFGPLANALAKGIDWVEPVPTRKSVAFSIAAPISTYQALLALRESNGHSIVVGEDKEILFMQQELGQEGIYAEASSVATLVAVKKMAADQLIKSDDLVVAIITSTGLKDPRATHSILRDVPVIQPNFEDLSDALRNVYGKSLQS